MKQTSLPLPLYGLALSVSFGGCFASSLSLAYLDVLHTHTQPYLHSQPNTLHRIEVLRFVAFFVARKQFNASDRTSIRAKREATSPPITTTYHCTTKPMALICTVCIVTVRGSFKAQIKRQTDTTTTTTSSQTVAKESKKNVKANYYY